MSVPTGAGNENTWHVVGMAGEGINIGLHSLLV